MDFFREMDWYRLVRFLAGECSPELEKKTQSWILEDEGRAKLMDDLTRIWEASEEPMPSRDVEAAWEEVRGELEAESERMGRESGIEEEGANSRSDSSSPGTDENESRAHDGHSQPRGHARIPRIAVVASGLLIAVLSLALWYTQDSVLSADETGSRTFSTDAGQRATVRLSDGSQVRLNVDSRLALESGFGERNRTVSLDGEAFFEVTDESAHPFVVEADGARTEVLGTTFSVRAYPDENGRRVAVSEGRVTVRPHPSGNQETVHLTAHNLGVFAGGHVQVVRRNANIQKAMAWTKGRLVFDDTPFDKVVRELQRWYDIPVEAQVEPEEVDHLNATFEEESVQEALEAIAAALDLQYRREGETVIFYRDD